MRGGRETDLRQEIEKKEKAKEDKSNGEVIQKENDLCKPQHSKPDINQLQPFKIIQMH